MVSRWCLCLELCTDLLLDGSCWVANVEAVESGELDRYKDLCFDFPSHETRRFLNRQIMALVITFVRRWCCSNRDSLSALGKSSPSSQRRQSDHCCSTLFRRCFYLQYIRDIDG